MKKIISFALCIVSLMGVLLLSSCGADKNGKLMSLKIYDAELACHVDMDKVLDVFSEHEYEYFESISCAYNGMDKTYDFVDDGFCITTYPVDNKDFILEIMITSDKITQKDGKVYVGMSKDEVISLFGSEYVEEGDLITYTVKDEQTMSFLISDNKVVEYGISAAE